MSVPEQVFRKPLTKLIALLFLSALLLALPHLVQRGYAIRVINNIMLYSILAIGLNLVGGYGGQLAMGHACYIGVGAYTSALLTMQLGWPFLPAFLCAILAAGVFGFLSGFILLTRITGDYLMIVTMGVSEIMRLVFMNWVSLTRGPMGIPQVPAVKILSFTFKSNTHYYYLILAMLVLTGFIVSRLVRSRFGRALVAVREDEVAAKAMGVNATFYKVMAFGISTLFAGLAGSLQAHYTHFVGPMQFSLDEGLLLFQMIIIGGLGSISGSIVGAAILVIIPELFRPIYQYRMLFNGLLMILMMIWKPQGLLGTVGAFHPVVRWANYLKRIICPRRGGTRGAA
jgi:branched-chain amino acid transport system permease protein